MSDSPLERSLYEAFAERTIRRGNELYFSRDIAGEFIDACDRRDVAVIGIEGFQIEDNATLPDMEYIADYSAELGTSDWTRLRMSNNASARNFIQSAPAHLFFNFVIRGVIPCD